MEFTTKQIQYPIGKQCQNDDCRWTMPTGYEATQIKNDCSVFCSDECAHHDYYNNNGGW